MSVRIDQMKARIVSVYDTVYWKRKVDRMADAQVVAIYYAFLHNNKFNTISPKNKNSELHQITLFECGLK